MKKKPSLSYTVSSSSRSDRKKKEENGLAHVPLTTIPHLGLFEWLRVDDYAKVEQLIHVLRMLGLKEYRLCISWADMSTLKGKVWYRWLLPKLAEHVNLLVCLLYTPPSLGLVQKVSSPPRDPQVFAAFLYDVIVEFGSYFEWVELWNEPNNVNYWDGRLDPEWRIFSSMIHPAALVAKEHGKKVVLPGLCPTDPNWLRHITQQLHATPIDAVSLHWFPGTWEPGDDDMTHTIHEVRAILNQWQPNVELWMTETGYSTWRHDELQQLRTFVKALESPVERVYWYGLSDSPPDSTNPFGQHTDDRHYHFGLLRSGDSPKLLYRLWSEQGLPAVRNAAWLDRSIINSRKRHPVLITGGAGFIGSNLAHHLLSQGHPVIVYDNLSRQGVETNLQWLTEQHGELLQIEVADMRDFRSLKRVLDGVTQVYHFAAQVAVTTSITGARHDFEVNAAGTVNLLEAIRMLPHPPPLLLTSTNKVYGNLDGLDLKDCGSRYQPVDETIRSHGISEQWPLNFHSPYGCSKGTADQYVLDYGRTYSLPVVVFRMSCIYGPHQFGTEDQGWVAHFLLRALQGRPISIFGDGKQVRDVLYVDDLINAFLLAMKHIPLTGGRAYNIGGGPQKSLSLLELTHHLELMVRPKPVIEFGDWRTGDQPYYVSDTRAFQILTGWEPGVSVPEGIDRLHKWLLTSSTPSTMAASMAGS